VFASFLFVVTTRPSQDDLKVVRSLVVGCEQYMLESRQKQDVTMRGVQLLCSVVAESLGHTTNSRKKLEVRKGDLLLL